MSTQKKNILIAKRSQDFDCVGCKDYGDRPYAVVLDVHNVEGDFIESGTDWSYFKTEEQAQQFINEYNKNK